MPKFITPKTYALAVGILLFAFGIVGFAFRIYFNLADKYLFISLLLGVWGIFAAINRGE